MEKQFSVTFDLSKMQVLIPSGRLMNLKEQLNWNDIDLDKKELDQLVQHVSAQNFELDLDFKKQSEAFINSKMDSKLEQSTRKASYAELGIKEVLRPEHFEKVTSNLIVEFREQIGQLLEDTKEVDLISKKMSKLAQLKLMNKSV